MKLLYAALALVLLTGCTLFARKAKKNESSKQVAPSSSFLIYLQQILMAKNGKCQSLKANIF
jgi:outer membrane biogenesis lipoprotein LolB